VSDIAEAKRRLPLPTLLHRLGLGEHAKKSARCPFHDDKNNSFSVYQNANGNWRWKCHTGCGAGDEIDFVVRLRNAATSEACRAYVDLAGVNRNATTACTNQERQNKRMSKPSNCAGDINLSTDEGCRQVCAMIDRLATDDQLLDRIAKARDWKKETIKQIALEGYLGWHNGKVAFIYDTGCKVRWRQDGERVIRWLFGKPWIWRGAYLSISSRTKVFLCEGETDAIALLDVGVENDLAKVVVAAPSASTFNENWAVLFEHKTVVLCFDDDVAGNAAVDRVAKILRPYARDVQAIDWEGIGRAC
jgi:Toprim-like/CHC2 zinc finger